MSNLQQIARTSRRYRRLLTLIFFLVPLIHSLAWAFIEYIPQHWAHQRSYEIIDGFTPAIRCLAFFASMIKGGIVMYGIWVLIRLFKLEGAGFFLPRPS